METEMNLVTGGDSSETDINQVVHLIETLYNSKNPAEQAEANRRLTELQSSDNVWHLCWPLLDPSRSFSIEVHFFAANTLVQKINQSWAQQNDDWLENQLRPKLFETLVNYASSPNGGKLVIERLALALASLALHTIPTFWPDAIENILQTFTPQNLPVTISSQRVCDILLKILMYIPEEYSVLMPQQDHRAKLNFQMTKSGPLVFKFLHSLLMADTGVITSECKQSVLKCLTSWTMHSRTSLLEIDAGKAVLDMIYSLVMDQELCSFACATLAATFSCQKAESFRGAVIDFIPKIANLRQVIEKYMGEDDIENAIKIYSLIINFSENHSRLFLKIVLNDGIQLDQATNINQAIFTIIKTILDCTSAPGIYNIDEKYSDISFTFWFNFFENFYYYSDSFNDVICETFDPLVDSLFQVLITKSQYPPSSIYYQTWNDDQRESYRCYRQDLGDNISLIVHFPRSKERVLALLLKQLEHELSKFLNGPVGERSWQPLESIVFAIKSISESVPFDETKCVPKIFALLSQITFDESHALLYCTVAEMISAYSDWLFTHSTHLAIAFNILFLGIESPNSDVRLMSTLSLKDLTSECQTVLRPYARQIVESCSLAVLRINSSLTTNEKSRLMHSIGTTMAVAYDSLGSTLASLTGPFISEMVYYSSMSNPTTDPTCRTMILDRLAMLNSLIESFHVKEYSGNEYEFDGDENDPRVLDSILGSAGPAQLGADVQHPALTLLWQLVPTLKTIADKFRSDEEIMGTISNTIKRSAKSLGIEVKPVLNDLLLIIVNSYDPMLNSNILEGTLSLYMLFKNDQSVHSYLKNTFARISEKTLEVCIGNPLSQLTLTIESYFHYATFVFKRFQEFITTQSPDINIEYICKLAIASLELPEKKTLAEVAGFLSQFRQKSIGVEHLHRIFINNLDLMLNNIFNIFGGNYSTPRNAIDNVTDLLYSIMDADEVRLPLKLIVQRENFPTSYVSCDQKAKFVSRIAQERNRKKFKDACNEFVLIARNLNRLV